MATLPKKILILIDYRSQFYSSTLGRGNSLNLDWIATKLRRKGYSVLVKKYSEIDFQNDNYMNFYVLYKSSEDPQLYYKDFIEDILLGLYNQGAVLIPDFRYFRAHHNKVFMEIIRSSFKEGFGLNHANYYGTYEEYVESYNAESFPIIFKLADGAKGANVFIARTKLEADQIARKISFTPSYFNLKLKIKNFFDKKGYVPISNNRRKFIIQKFIPNISGDYKILVYGEKYFWFYRENRLNDFRASGTKNFVFTEDIPETVLNFSKRIFTFFQVPFISIDVGFDGNQCYLFEFQFVEFGQRAVQRSSYYYQQVENSWIRIKAKSNAEDEFVDAVHQYIILKKSE